jgi:hypothetical protein
VVPYIADFSHHALTRAEPVLDPEVPLLRVRIVEVGPD